VPREHFWESLRGNMCLRLERSATGSLQRGSFRQSKILLVLQVVLERRLRNLA